MSNFIENMFWSAEINANTTLSRFGDEQIMVSDRITFLVISLPITLGLIGIPYLLFNIDCDNAEAPSDCHTITYQYGLVVGIIIIGLVVTELIVFVKTKPTQPIQTSEKIE